MVSPRVARAHTASKCHEAKLLLRVLFRFVSNQRCGELSRVRSARGSWRTGRSYAASTRWSDHVAFPDPRGNASRDLATEQQSSISPHVQPGRTSHSAFSRHESALGQARRAKDRTVQAERPSKPHFMRASRGRTTDTCHRKALKRTCLRDILQAQHTIEECKDCTFS
jgi:hypothetical protein